MPIVIVRSINLSIIVALTHMQIPGFLPVQHTNYDRLAGDKKEHLNNILDLLKTPTRLADGTIQKKSDETKIPKGTLKTWRKKLLANPNSTLIVHGAKVYQEYLIGRFEDSIYTKIMEDCIQQRRYCSLKTVQTDR